MSGINSTGARFLSGKMFEDGGRCLVEISADHPIRQALKIGQKVLKFVGENYDCTDISFADCHMFTNRITNVVVEKRPIEPKPLTGLDYLKSLPVGTIWSYNHEQLRMDQFVVVNGGICWFARSIYDYEQLWTWDGEDFPESDIRNDASPETCLEWKPKEDKDDQ